MPDPARWRGYLTIVLLNLTALGAVVWQLRDPRATAVRVEPPPTRTPAPAPTEARLLVYVSGAVAQPGVVTLSPGARADAAVTAAGGFVPDADRASVNLAAPLADGQQLHVPVQGEAAPRPPGISGGPEQPVAGSGGRVNINSASAVDLESLPGVGPALAARIVAHRDAEGPFKQPEDLLAVSGIGEKTLARFADHIAVR